ncbi:MAG: SpoIIE family protein phosphatase [Clostridia bacterium]|nr:SpoIIE family protein phosphatase [Clostridia bacterium]
MPDINVINSILDRVRAVFFICDNDGTIQYVNEACRKYLKYSISDIVGQAITDFIIEEDHKKYELLCNAADDEKYWEINFIKADNSIEMLNCYRLAYDNCNVFVGRCNDANIVRLQEELMTINNEMANLYRELEKKNRQLEAMNRVLEKQRNEISQKNAIIQKQLDVARKIQSYFVKSGELKLYNLNFKFDYAPAYDIGGDFFDIIDLMDGKIGVFISDVSGHGISAALVMAVVRTIFLKQQENLTNPSKLLGEINREMNLIFGREEESFDELYCTAFYCVINTATSSIEYCSAGHPAAWVLNGNKKKDLESIGFPLGMFKKADYENLRISYDKNDKLVFFTDGFTDFVLNCSFQNVDYEQLFKTMKNSRVTEHLSDCGCVKDDVSLIIVEVDSAEK